jgi:hypothetical protein
MAGSLGDRVSPAPDRRELKLGFKLSVGRKGEVGNLEWRNRAMQKRRRFKQEQSFEDRLASYAKTARKVAALLPPGAEKDELLRKARQADTAVHLNAWANSPGLHQPK